MFVIIFNTELGLAISVLYLLLTVSITKSRNIFLASGKSLFWNIFQLAYRSTLNAPVRVEEAGLLRVDIFNEYPLSSSSPTPRNYHVIRRVFNLDLSARFSPSQGRVILYLIWKPILD